MDKLISATAAVVSLSPYSQSRFHNAPKLEKELPDAYEARTWRQRLHTDAQGSVIIPGIQFKKAMEGAAKLLKKRIPGRGAQTWTQHIISGITAVGNLNTGVAAGTVEGEWIHCDAQGGSRGVSTRVLRCYPVLTKWQGEVEFAIFDEMITEAVFHDFLEEAGVLIGLGRYRAAVGGTHGKFAVQKITWKPMGLKEFTKRAAA
jgi:hypothetical protein